MLPWASRLRPTTMAAPTLAAITMLIVACMAASCSRSETGSPARPAGPLRIVVSQPPLLSLARALAPPDAQVVSLTPPGVSEHTYEPPPSAIANLLNADLVVLVGLGLEARIEPALAQQPRAWRHVLVFAECVGVHASDTHDAGHTDADASGHHHEGVDPHLWLDPTLVARFVPALRQSIQASLAGLGLLTDAERARLDSAEKSLLDEIRAVDREYSTALASVPGRVIITHHDAFSRPAGRYNLEVAAVMRPIDAVEATPGDVSDVVAAIRTRGARVIFIEPQYSPAAAERIARLTGVRVLHLDPLGNGDWSKMMRTNLKSLVDGLSTPTQ